MLFIEAKAKNGDKIHLLFEKISEAMVECIQNKPILNENEICSKLLGKYKEEEKIEISKKSYVVKFNY